MRIPCPPLIQRLVLATFLFCLTNLTAGGTEVTSNSLEWSLSTPPVEAAPRSFPAVAVHVQNRAEIPAKLHLHFDLGKLRSLGGDDLEVALDPHGENTVLYTLYVPPETPGGSDLVVTARADDGTLRRTSIRIKNTPACKVTADSMDTRFARPGDKVSYTMKIANTGNVPLHCAIELNTSPPVPSMIVTPQNLVVPAGENAEATVQVVAGPMKTFTSFVTSAEVKTAELSGDNARQFLYFHTEAFPEAVPPDRTQLYETLKGSAFLGFGSGNGNNNAQAGANGLVIEALTLEGMITDKTRLQFIEAYAHPSNDDGNSSSAYSALPNGSTRNFFHLGLYNPSFDLEGGEITTAPARLLSSRETGDGVRAAVRPLGNDKLQVEAFWEQNTLTLNNEQVFGAAVNGVVLNSPLEWWRVGELSKRGDIGPQGSNWNAVAIDTGWKIPLTTPLRAELSLAGGDNGEGHGGLACLAGIYYNRTLPGETNDSPLQAGFEYAYGDRDYPGEQNGRDDRRAYLSYRFSSSPTLLEAYANYNDSNYQVVPVIQKTLEQEQSLIPDFLLTSQTQLINAGFRWNTVDAAHTSWHLPTGFAEYEETSFFNQSNFLDKTSENAGAISLQVLNQLQPRPNGSNWQLTVLTRGGNETDQNNGEPERDSGFATLGTDLSFNSHAPEFLERIGGPGQLSAQLSGRYTFNFADDTQAVNRTGVSMTAAVAWQSEIWSVKTGTTFYSYIDQGFSARVWASMTRRIGKGWWAGIEGAYTHRGSGSSGTGEPDQSAVLLTFRHDFELAVPWLPRRGEVEGHVFRDLNNNGRQDPGEPGLEGVKVAVGKDQALSGPDGVFSFSPMTDGSYPVTVTPPGDVHLSPSGESPVTQTALHKGAVTDLAIGMVEPTTCEGKVHFVHEISEAADDHPDDKTEDLSGLEVVCTDPAGHVVRGGTRADGFFAVYLEPGTYEVKIDPATLKAQQVVNPEKIFLKVDHSRIQNLSFTVTERAKRIRKTFSTENP